MKEVEKATSRIWEEGGIAYDLLRGTSQNYTVYPFGSRVMGVGLRYSDLDIFVDVGKWN